MLFDIQSRTVGETEVISVIGDLDLAGLPRLAMALGDLGGSRAGSDLTVDLSGVDYMDPVCLGALVAAELRVRRSGAVFTVLAGDAVRVLFAETRLDKILTVEGP